MTYMAVRRMARAASWATYSSTTFSSASYIIYIIIYNNIYDEINIIYTLLAVLVPGLRLGLSITTSNIDDFLKFRIFHTKTVSLKSNFHFVMCSVFDPETCLRPVVVNYF